MQARASEKRRIGRPVAGRAWISAALVVSAMAVSVGSGPVRADCTEAARALRTALAARDLDAAQRHHDAVWREPSCDDRFRDRAGRAVSLLHAQVAQERLAAGGEPRVPACVAGTRARLCTDVAAPRAPRRRRPRRARLRPRLGVVPGGVDRD